MDLKMEHAVTVKDVLIASAVIGGPMIIIGLIFWFLSTIDLSH